MLLPENNTESDETDDETAAQSKSTDTRTYVRTHTHTHAHKHTLICTVRNLRDIDILEVKKTLFRNPGRSRSHFPKTLVRTHKTSLAT